MQSTKFEYEMLHSPLTKKELIEGKLNRKVNNESSRSIDFSWREIRLIGRKGINKNGKDKMYCFSLIDDHVWQNDLYFSLEEIWTIPEILENINSWLNGEVCIISQPDSDKLKEKYFSGTIVKE